MKGRDTFQIIFALRTKVEHDVLALGKRAPLARQALNLLYRKPVLSAAELANGLKVTPPTANSLIRALIKLGVLKEISGMRRNRVYMFEVYLDLFLI